MNEQIKELAIKHGRVLQNSYSAMSMKAGNIIFRDLSQLDALLAEHIAVNSGEPVAWMDEFGSVATKGYKNAYAGVSESYSNPLYTANPLNKELLDAVKSLRESLHKISSETQDTNLLWWQTESRKALASLSPNVTKLLESES